MKIVIILSLSLAPAILPAQENPTERNPWKSAPPAMPNAIVNARIHSQTVLRGASSIAGGNLILQRIDPPAPTKITPVPAPVAAARQFSPEEWAARRASEPNELQLFSPTVIVHAHGVSMVRWGALDPLTGYRQYAAWVKMDLSTINSCGDVIVGRRRYCLMPMMFHATDRMVQQWKAPAVKDFQLPTDIILAEGDASNKRALEPLHALLERYDTHGDEIAANAASIKADQIARAAWEKAHPQQPEDAIIKFWPIQSTEYPAKSAK